MKRHKRLLLVSSFVGWDASAIRSRILPADEEHEEEVGNTNRPKKFRKRARKRAKRKDRPIHRKLPIAKLKTKQDSTNKGTTSSADQRAEKRTDSTAASGDWEPSSASIAGSGDWGPSSASIAGSGEWEPSSASISGSGDWGPSSASIAGSGDWEPSSASISANGEWERITSISANRDWQGVVPRSANEYQDWKKVTSNWTNTTSSSRRININKFSYTGGDENGQLGYGLDPSQQRFYPGLRGLVPGQPLDIGIAASFLNVPNSMKYEGQYPMDDQTVARGNITSFLQANDDEEEEENYTSVSVGEGGESGDAGEESAAADSSTADASADLSRTDGPKDASGKPASGFIWKRAKDSGREDSAKTIDSSTTISEDGATVHTAADAGMLPGKREQKHVGEAHQYIEQVTRFAKSLTNDQQLERFASQLVSFVEKSPFAFAAEPDEHWEPVKRAKNALQAALATLKNSRSETSPDGALLDEEQKQIMQSRLATAMRDVVTKWNAFVGLSEDGEKQAGTNFGRLALLILAIPGIWEDNSLYFTTHAKVEKFLIYANSILDAVQEMNEQPTDESEYQSAIVEKVRNCWDGKPFEVTKSLPGGVLQRETSELLDRVHQIKDAIAAAKKVRAPLKDIEGARQNVPWLRDQEEHPAEEESTFPGYHMFGYTRVSDADEVVCTAADTLPPAQRDGCNGLGKNALEYIDEFSKFVESANVDSAPWLESELGRKSFLSVAEGLQKFVDQFPFDQERDGKVFEQYWSPVKKAAGELQGALDAFPKSGPREEIKEDARLLLDGVKAVIVAWKKFVGQGEDGSQTNFGRLALLRHAMQEQTDAFQGSDMGDGASQLLSMFFIYAGTIVAHLYAGENVARGLEKSFILDIVNGVITQWKSIIDSLEIAERVQTRCYSVELQDSTKGKIDAFNAGLYRFQTLLRKRFNDKGIVFKKANDLRMTPFIPQIPFGVGCWVFMLENKSLATAVRLVPWMNDSTHDAELDDLAGSDGDGQEHGDGDGGDGDGSTGQSDSANTEMDRLTDDNEQWERQEEEYAEEYFAQAMKGMVKIRAGGTSIFGEHTNKLLTETVFDAGWSFDGSDKHTSEAQLYFSSVQNFVLLLNGEDSDEKGREFFYGCCEGSGSGKALLQLRKVAGQLQDWTAGMNNPIRKIWTRSSSNESQKRCLADSFDAVMDAEFAIGDLGEVYEGTEVAEAASNDISELLEKMEAVVNAWAAFLGQGAQGSQTNFGRLLLLQEGAFMERRNFRKLEARAMSSDASKEVLSNFFAYAESIIDSLPGPAAITNDCIVEIVNDVIRRWGEIIDHAQSISLSSTDDTRTCRKLSKETKERVVALDRRLDSLQGTLGIAFNEININGKLFPQMSCWLLAEADECGDAGDAVPWVTDEIDLRGLTSISTSDGSRSGATLVLTAADIPGSGEFGAAQQYIRKVETFTQIIEPESKHRSAARFQQLEPEEKLWVVKNVARQLLTFVTNSPFAKLIGSGPPSQPEQSSAKKYWWDVSKAAKSLDTVASEGNSGGFMDIAAKMSEVVRQWKTFVGWSPPGTNFGRLSLLIYTIREIWATNGVPSLELDKVRSFITYAGAMLDMVESVELKQGISTETDTQVSPEYRIKIAKIVGSAWKSRIFCGKSAMSEPNPETELRGQLNDLNRRLSEILGVKAPVVKACPEEAATANGGAQASKSTASAPARQKQPSRSRAAGVNGGTGSAVGTTSGGHGNIGGGAQASKIGGTAGRLGKKSGKRRA
ncbi:unnamed protein product [Amoebophrya sp. A25]|nr:unnamed protein product [Amoebophrya sp. A25]|eukprot:GSA25T00022189001.1